MCADKSIGGLPEYIEPLRLAKTGHEISGQIALAKMPRLVQSLANSNGYADIWLQFGKNMEGIFCINGQVQASLILICQRCILPLEYNVNHTFVLAPVHSDTAAKKLPDYLEPVLLSSDDKLSVIELIEDELILQLPVIAKHAEAECSIKIVATEPSSIAKKDKPNPFATLVALKKQ